MYLLSIAMKIHSFVYCMISKMYTNGSRIILIRSAICLLFIQQYVLKVCPH